MNVTSSYGFDKDAGKLVFRLPDFGFEGVFLFFLSFPCERFSVYAPHARFVPNFEVLHLLLIHFCGEMTAFVAMLARTLSYLGQVNQVLSPGSQYWFKGICAGKPWGIETRFWCRFSKPIR